MRILLFFLLFIVQSCNRMPSSQIAVNDKQTKEEEVKRSKPTILTNNLNKKNLPVGVADLMKFTDPLTIHDESNDLNSSYLDIIYQCNRYYNPAGTDTTPIDPLLLKNLHGLSYHDIEVTSKEISITDSTTSIIEVLSSNTNHTLLTCKLNISKPRIQNDKKNTPSNLEVINLYTYDQDRDEIVDGLNIYYSVNLSFNYDKARFKKFNSGLVNKFYYIDANNLINLFYIDYIYQGEGAQYDFLIKEQWQVNSSDQFVRYFEADGPFVSKSEQGSVNNTMQDGVWIEIKPNAYVEQITYAETKYRKGVRIGEWYFYDYNEDKKGALLYTETYKNGNSISRKFVNLPND